MAQVRALAPGAMDMDPEEGRSLDQLGGVTPLMAAGGHEEVVEVLLACGADAARCDAQGHLAAAHACAAGHAHLALRLKMVVDKDQTIW